MCSLLKMLFLPYILNAQLSATARKPSLISPVPTFPYQDWYWGSHSSPVGPKVPSEDNEMF